MKNRVIPILVGLLAIIDIWEMFTYLGQENSKALCYQYGGCDINLLKLMHSNPLPTIVFVTSLLIFLSVIGYVTNKE